MAAAGLARQDSEVGGALSTAYSDDGVTYDGSSDRGGDLPALNHWMVSAQQSLGGDMSMPFWQQENQWGVDQDVTGAGLDWQNQGWNLPMAAMGNDWRNGNRMAGMAGLANRAKRRFCTSYPDVSMCRRGASCAYAHSREEISVPLLELEEEQQEPSALTDEFFMFKYKMRWCPIGVQHEWHTCVYAHNYQDARRPVEIGYGARLCPYWSKKDTGAEYSQRCPLGLRCPYSHGAKEQLYHPQYFKTVICRDLRGKACPRQKLCAFFHHRNERRNIPADEVDYSQPLSSEALPAEWVPEFLSPPFLPEQGKQNHDGKAEGMYANGQMNSQMSVDQYGQMVFFLPMGPMSPGMESGQNGIGSQMPEINSPTHGASQDPSSAQNWVFVPMEGQGAPMPMA